jgi:hypothetical protein
MRGPPGSRASFGLATVRLVLVVVPEPEQIIAETDGHARRSTR